MALIAEKVAAGVTLERIVAALKVDDIEVSAATLKSYLYRYRRKLKAAKPQPAQPDAGTSAPHPEPGNITERLTSLITRDPDKDAADFANYEQQGRKRK
jgi:hypothetical protein